MPAWHKNMAFPKNLLIGLLASGIAIGSPGFIRMGANY
jgi:hypothetical protein